MQSSFPSFALRWGYSAGLILLSLVKHSTGAPGFNFLTSLHRGVKKLSVRVTQITQCPLSIQTNINICLGWQWCSQWGGGVKGGAKTLPEIGEKGENREKEGKNREGSFTLTDRAGYATGGRFCALRYELFCKCSIDDLRISHNASGMGANIRVLVT